MPLFSDMGELLGKGVLGGTCNTHTSVRVGQSLSARFANHLLTKMLTLAGTARYRAEYGRPETPTKQASVVLNGIGRNGPCWTQNPVVATPWEITGRSEDELTGVMVQISQVVAEQLAKKGSDYVGDSRSGGRRQRQEALPRR